MSERITKRDMRVTAESADTFVRNNHKQKEQDLQELSEKLDSNIFYERFFEERFRNGPPTGTPRHEAGYTYSFFKEWQERAFNIFAENQAPVSHMAAEVVLDLSLQGAHEYAITAVETYAARFRVLLKQPGRRIEAGEYLDKSLKWEKYALNAGSAVRIERRKR